MERFEIRRLRAGALVVVLQHSFSARLGTCVVAPLVETSRLPPLTRIRPILTLDETEYVIVIDRLAAVDRGAIGAVVGNVSHLQDEIFLALDLLFKGF